LLFAAAGEIIAAGLVFPAFRSAATCLALGCANKGFLTADFLRGATEEAAAGLVFGYAEVFLSTSAETTFSLSSAGRLASLLRPSVSDTGKSENTANERATE